MRKLDWRFSKGILLKSVKVWFFGLVSSSVDFIKEVVFNDILDEEDFVVEIISCLNSNYSNYSSDCLSLVRIVLIGSSVLVFFVSISLENFVYDNLVYVDEKFLNYREVFNEIKVEDVRNLFLLEFIVW